MAKITLLFGLMKIVATTLGETLGDFISMTLNIGYLTGIIVTLVFFLGFLIIQLNTKKYIAAFYWIVIIGTTTLGLRSLILLIEVYIWDMHGEAFF